MRQNNIEQKKLRSIKRKELYFSETKKQAQNNIVNLTYTQ
jgi:hypothetical protein